MADRTERAWEIAQERLPKAERDRLLRIANQLNVDPADPVWVMLLATGLTREELVTTRKKTAKEIDEAIDRLSAELTAQRKAEVEHARQRLTAEREAEEEKLREAAIEAVNAGAARGQRATGWKWAAAAIGLALILSASLFVAGAVVGQQDAAITQDRIAERFQGPYTPAEEKLLVITGNNLVRADRIMQQCRENTFKPDQGGQACKVAMWVDKPDASRPESSPSWPARVWSWLSDTLEM